MALFLEAGFVGTVVACPNRVRKYKGLVHLSDGTTGDGNQIEQDVLTEKPCEGSRITFPGEFPTRSDFKLWNEAVRSVTSASIRLATPVGPFLCKGHKK